MEAVAAGIGSGSLLRSLYWRAIQAWHAVSSMETRQGASTMLLHTVTEAVRKDFRAAKGDEQHGTVTCAVLPREPWQTHAGAERPTELVSLPGG